MGEDEQRDTLQKTLNRLNEHCMNRFDETNAKLEEQTKEIARRRLALTSAGKAAGKSKPKVTERKPVEKPKSSKQERPKRLVRNSSAGTKTTKSMTKFASPHRQTEKNTWMSKTTARMMEISIDCGSDGSERGKPTSEKYEVPVKRKSKTTGKKNHKGSRLNPVAITGRVIRNSASRPSFVNEEH